MQFQVEGKAEVRALNVSKGNQDESPVCATVSYRFEAVGPEPAIAALGCRAEDIDALFTGDANDSRFTGIEDIVAWATFEDSHKIQFLGFKCDVRKVSAIKFKPIGGKKFNMTLNVQVQDPPDGFLPKVAAALHQDRAVKILPTSLL